MTPTRIHIVGASGSGATTLGGALARVLRCHHWDTDDFYWSPTHPPFRTPRPVDERLVLLEAALGGETSWTLSGSLISWGDSLIPRFDLVVFLYVPPHIRIDRLLFRERERYGAAIAPGGHMHALHTAFIDWAKAYDAPDFTGRSLARHRAWLGRLTCPVVEIVGTPTVEESVQRVLNDAF